MKTLITFLILSFSVISSAQTCQLKLADLSRFQDAESKQIERVAFFDFLTKENKILFGKVHLASTYETISAENIDFKDFYRSYPLYSEKQQRDLADAIWKRISAEFNPALIEVKDDEGKPVTVSFRYANRNPEGLLDIDSFTRKDINIIRRFAGDLGYTYNQFLKNYEIIQAINNNPDLRNQVIQFVAVSLKQVTKASVNQYSSNHAAGRLKALNWGTFSDERDPAKPDDNSTGAVVTSVGSFLGVLGGTVIGGIATATSSDHWLFGVPLGLSIMAATPIMYSTPRVAQISYNKAAVKIRNFFEKRRARKLAAKGDQTSPRNDEGE